MRVTSASGMPVAPLGLGAREDRNAEAVGTAARHGVNFFFFYHLSGGSWAAALADLVSHRPSDLVSHRPSGPPSFRPTEPATHRQPDPPPSRPTGALKRRADQVIATGSGRRDRAAMRRSLDACLEALRTDYLDIFFAEYVQPDEEADRIHGSSGALAELHAWKRAGVIRYVGASAHDRTVSRRLAEDPRVDVLMQRYNMAHRAAALEVFPACLANDVALVAFTATRWGTLLAGHADWPSEPPSAGDCYRFCMAHAAVDVTLAAPANAAELQHDLEALRQPRMNARELDRWKQYGDLVYGDGTDSFETDWP